MADFFGKLSLGAILFALSAFAVPFPVSAQTCNPAVQTCS